MKNKIFKIAVIMAMCASICGCGLFKKVPKQNEGNGITFGTPVMYGQTMLINNRQLDSICVVDGISRDLDKWILTSYYDYETHNRVDRYVFIKLISETDELTYILTPKDTLYRITKRIVKEEDE